MEYFVVFGHLRFSPTFSFSFSDARAGVDILSLYAQTPNQSLINPRTWAACDRIGIERADFGLQHLVTSEHNRTFLEVLLFLVFLRASTNCYRLLGRGAQWEVFDL